MKNRPQPQPESDQPKKRKLRRGHRPAGSTDADRIVIAIEAATAMLVVAIEGLLADMLHGRSAGASIAASIPAGRSMTDAELCEQGTLSINDAAAVIGIDRKTLYKLMDDGRLSYTRGNAYRRIPKASVILYLTNHLVRGED